MNNFIYKFYSIVLILIIFACIINFTSFSSSSLAFSNKDSNSNDSSNENYFFSNSDFFWPVPGFHKITSYFGPRKSPTSGSSSNHSGIDISAPEGTVIYAVIDGIVSSIGFKRSQWL